MKQFIKYGILIVPAVMLIAAACAKQGAPSGGPRDLKPPVVVKSTPENSTTLFSGKTITITFDEFVTLDKIQEKFMISPPVEKKPDITLKGKNLVITIDEKLRDSTTYTLYFQDAIRDLNEGNILENYQFVFSTGDYIDSLTMAGQVYNAFDLEIPKNMMIMLYANMADSAPHKLIPDYISMTNQTGYFTVNSLRQGTYRLYALEDVNTNKTYEAGEESFAFLDVPVVITTEGNKTETDEDEEEPNEEEERLKEREAEADTTVAHIHRREPDYTLYSFKTPPSRYYLTSSVRKQARLLEYYFSLPLDTLSFSFAMEGVTEEDYFTEVSRNRDTFRIWLKDSLVFNNPSIETIITFPLTSQEGVTEYITDTIPMRFVQPRVPRGGVVRKPFSIQTNAARNGIPPGRDILIIPEAPLLRVDTSLISIVESGDSLETLLSFETLFDTLAPRQLVLKQSLEEDRDYRLQLLPGALRSIYEETNDTISVPFKIRPGASYGTFTANLTGYEGNVVVQLLDVKEDIIMEQPLSAPGKTVFKFVENGRYRLRVIYDTDNNGKWTPGDFLYNRQPESVSYFMETLDIKSNWDLSQDWDIGEKNVKNEQLRAKVPQRR